MFPYSTKSGQDPLYSYLCTKITSSLMLLGTATEVAIIFSPKTDYSWGNWYRCCGFVDQFPTSNISDELNV